MRFQSVQPKHVSGENIKKGRPLFPQKDKGDCSPLKVKPLFLEGKKEKARPDKRDNAFIDRDRRIG